MLSTFSNSVQEMSNLSTRVQGQHIYSSLLAKFTFLIGAQAASFLNVTYRINLNYIQYFTWKKFLYMVQAGREL